MPEGIGFDIILIISGLLVGALGGYLTTNWIAKIKKNRAEDLAIEITENAKKEALSIKREAELHRKDLILKEKNKLERENRDRRNEVNRLEKRVRQKEEHIEQKQIRTEEKEKILNQREEGLKEWESELNKSYDTYNKELEKIAQLTKDEARQKIIEKVQHEAELDAQKYVNKIEQETRLVADKKAKSIIATAIQRTATDTTADLCVSSVALPNDEMKGRIIGREGRNIRTLETLTGVDIIIDDTPEAIVLSCFDPIRREIAKIAINHLVQDGRIHPARIEEIVNKTNKEFTETIREEGEKACYDLGITGIHPELINYIGRLLYRTSYGQNLLIHSKEVAHLGSIIAKEIGANADLCKRAGLLHDVGKTLVIENAEGGHAIIGADLTKKYGEKPEVVNAIAAHHLEVEPKSIEAIIVQTADTISASRPGARKESFENYIKRLETLEKIANDVPEVEKSFAIQAGRELRIIANGNNNVPEKDLEKMVRGIAQKIEEEVKYPGQIKVTMIKETRIVDYAR